MPSARQSSAALADRAERHVFGLLGGLDAIERRALALVELAGADRAAASRELGLDAAEPLALARKALRRTRGPLASGGRCERAERLISDRLDAPLEREQRKWLEIHLARCPRCIEHERLLDEARTELRVSFLAEPPRLPPAPEPPALAEPPQPPEPPAPRGHLRAVPPPPDPAPAVGETHPTQRFPRPPLAEPEAAPAPPAPSPPTTPAPSADHRRPAPKPRTPAPKPRRAPSPAARRAARIAALLAILAAVIAAAIAALGSGDDTPQRAPWDSPSAPEVHPAPLRDQ